MIQRIKVADCELTENLRTISGLAGYAHLQLLIRWQGKPIGQIKIPVHGDVCLAADIARETLLQHLPKILNQTLRAALRSELPVENWQINHLLKLPPEFSKEILPSVSVAVCTRDRTKNLNDCLAALKKLEYPPLEILVIDNAPGTNATRELIENCFPEVRYILEQRPGLDWARNRAIAEARGEILAFTDDDVMVDSFWSEQLATVFAENPDVMAVTGLVLPYELETEAQIFFEEYGGFGRGFDRKWYRASKPECRHAASEFIGAGKFGTGANMAYRRAIFSEVGMFDPALDVGTVTQGGGDLDMFFRVLKHGHTLVYEPAALVRHRHRGSFQKLELQLASNGIGFFSHLVRNAIAFPEERKGIAKFGLHWLWSWGVRRSLRAFFKPTAFPRKLILVELRGFFVGLVRYQKARRQSDAIEEQFGPATALKQTADEHPSALKSTHYGTAIRTVEIACGLQPLEDVSEYFQTRLLVTRHGSAIGQVDILNRYCPISAARLSDEIVNALGIKILPQSEFAPLEKLWINAYADFKNCFPNLQSDAALPEQLSISVVIATCDRAEKLRACLKSLVRQRTKRRVEIVVVDNRPESQITPPVVAEFPNVRLIQENRAGLSYARNAGFLASTGDVLVCTDDDVVAPPDWLEKIVAPFTRNDVMLVTGNVLPAELASAAQVQFENYGGLGRGFERREFNRNWFNSFRRKAVPTWEIGATANAAIRASILRAPEIGLLDEALGAGMPTGCSEDTYLFYKILLAGHTIIYEPAAYVWHHHRAEHRELRKQIYSYSKGHVAYHLTTFLREGDARGLVRIFAELPRHHLQQLCRWLDGKHERPLRTLLLEIFGNLAGAPALWSARRRVANLGPSSPCAPLQSPGIDEPSVKFAMKKRREKRSPIFKPIETKME